LLVAFGIWLVAFSVLIRPDVPTARAQVAAGVALAGVGLLLLVRTLRRIRASAVSRVELALPAGCVLHPGANVPVRVRLAGPARVDRLVVRAICERQYTRQVMTPGSTAVSTANEVEELWRQDLLDERNVVVPTRAPSDRVLTLAVSTLARPTGPVMPAGTVAWRLEVASGPDAQVNQVYDISVPSSAEDAVAVTGAPPTADRSARPLTRDDAATGLGCGVITLAFLLIGPIFLWFYFSDVPTKRGNPVMGLVAGVLFTSLGLVALFALIKGFFGRDGRNRAGGRAGPPLP
jgi:hypothetical protein